MTNDTLPESISFKLPSLTFTDNMNLNKYIEVIAKVVKVCSLYCVSYSHPRVSFVMHGVLSHFLMECVLTQRTYTLST